MRRPLLAAALCATLGTGGCYCSHERGPSPPEAGVPDAARPADAPAPAHDAPARADVLGPSDAGPEAGRHWVPAPPGGAELLVERCELREGQTPIFRVRLTLSLCDEPGNVRWAIDHAARAVTLDPFAWRPVGAPPCPPATYEVVRDVALRGAALVAGTWTVALADGSAATSFEVGPGPPELTCTDCLGPGAPCAIDEECAGDRTCVAMRGDGACRSTCEAPCQPFPEATGEGRSDLTCAARLGVAASCDEDPTLGWLCREARVDLCPPCTPGAGCRSDADFTSYCAWDRSPWDAGGACAEDEDCLPGLSCVELAGARTCQVRCRSDHTCPFGECGPTRVVCEVPEI